MGCLLCGLGEGGEEGGGDVGGGDGAEALEGDDHAAVAAHAPHGAFDAGEGAGGDAHALSLGEGGADAVEVFESGGSGAAHQYKHLHLGVGDHGEGAVGGAVEAEWYGAGGFEGEGVGRLCAGEHEPRHGRPFGHTAAAVGVFGCDTDGGHVGFVDLRGQIIAYLEHAVIVYVECEPGHCRFWL